MRTVAAVLSLTAILAGCDRGRTESAVPHETTGQPYLRLARRVDDISVWIVDGEYVRENLDVEFTNFGQHYAFPFIPADEFWLDQEQAPGEERFFITHLLVEHHLMAGGMEYDPALVRGDSAESAERVQTTKGRVARSILETGRRAPLLERIHEELLPAYSGAVKVWVVDGELVRDLFFVDFTEGGHDKVYRFVPANEVWIDDDLMIGERPFVILHELHERRLMSRGVDYDSAHEESSRIELQCRRQPAELASMLAVELGREPPPR